MNDVALGGLSTMSNGVAVPDSVIVMGTADRFTVVRGQFLADDPLATFALVAGMEPVHGTVSFDAKRSGAVSYSVTQGYSGSDSFSYSVTDSTGLVEVRTVAVTLYKWSEAPP